MYTKKLRAAAQEVSQFCAAVQSLPAQTAGGLPFADPHTIHRQVSSALLLFFPPCPAAVIENTIVDSHGPTLDLHSEVSGRQLADP